jgi:hypothetical protein
MSKNNIWKSFMNKSKNEHLEDPLQILLQLHSNLFGKKWKPTNKSEKEEKKALYNYIHSKIPLEMFKDKSVTIDLYDSTADDMSIEISENNDNLIEPNWDLPPIPREKCVKEFLQVNSSQEEQPPKNKQQSIEDEFISSIDISEKPIKINAEKVTSKNKMVLGSLKPEKVIEAKEPPSLVDVKSKVEKDQGNTKKHPKKCRSHREMRGESVYLKWVRSRCYPQTVEQYKKLIMAINPGSMPPSRSLKQKYVDIFQNLILTEKYENEFLELLEEMESKFDGENIKKNAVKLFNKYKEVFEDDKSDI